MTRLLDDIRMALVPRSSRSTFPTISFDQWLSYFTFGGSQYPLGMTQTLKGDREEIDAGFAGLVQGAYRNNGIVFATELARFMLFSEARFQWQQLRNGRPGELFGTPDLGILETPWPGGTTGDLLTRSLVMADLAGTSFIVRRRSDPTRLRFVTRPDWMSFVIGLREPTDTPELDGDLRGFMFHPGGHAAGREPEVLMPDEVSYFAPTPDPMSRFRGMSWLTPVIREITGDTAATNHKLRYFENGATPNMVVSLDPSIPTQTFKDWIALFKEKEPVGADVYKTMYLGGGAKVELVGSDLKQLDFKTVQGAGETRIAAAGGVPPVIAGFSEGLQAATYSNYSQARRRFVDGTIRPLWRNFAGSLQSILPPPPGARLWYDDRDIAFLREDAKDRADIQSVEAQSIRTLVDAGFEPDSIKASILAEDWSLLKHSNLYSVQLQPANPDGPKTPDDPARTLLAYLAAQSAREAPRDPQTEDILAGMAMTMRSIAERGSSAPVIQNYLPTPEVHNEVNVAAADVRMEPIFQVPESPAAEVRFEPIINVAAPDPTPIHVEAPVIHNEIRAESPATLDVNIATTPARRKKVVERDQQGRIKSVTEEDIS